MIRNAKRSRMIPILPWFELFLENDRKSYLGPTTVENFFSSQIQNNLGTLYVPPKFRFLALKFQKISITRGRNFFSSQIRNNNSTLDIS